ncbi:MAG TPA: glutamate racemase [Polyangiaceae bacterium]|nr:glutamate racemase [Polyangiaceae bacterium]
MRGPADPAAPLGVFDSGLGGLTVARALLRALPSERIIYLGDTARVPYGTRSAQTVVRYARGCTELLIERGVKGIVVACNTVSAVAIDILRAELDLPVIGVIEPGARAALAAVSALPRSGATSPKIGILGTTGTVASGAYPRAVGQLSTRYEVVAQAAPLLVPLAEEGWVEGDVPRLVVYRYLEPLIAAGASVIVLGCTHFPLLKGVIAEVALELAGRPVPIVDSAEATAAVVAEWIADERLTPSSSERTPENALELLVTDLPASFSVVAGRFLGGDASHATQVDLIAK